MNAIGNSDLPQRLPTEQHPAEPDEHRDLRAHFQLHQRLRAAERVTEQTEHEQRDGSRRTTADFLELQGCTLVPEEPADPREDHRPLHAPPRLPERLVQIEVRRHVQREQTGQHRPDHSGRPVSFQQFRRDGAHGSVVDHGAQQLRAGRFEAALHFFHVRELRAMTSRDEQAALRPSRDDLRVRVGQRRRRVDDDRAVLLGHLLEHVDELRAAEQFLRVRRHGARARTRRCSRDCTAGERFVVAISTA